MRRACRGRAADLSYSTSAADLSARYNAIGNFSRVTEVATPSLESAALRGNSAAFKEFAWRFVNIIARALVDLAGGPIT